jgi:hypothetical protein
MGEHEEVGPPKSLRTVPRLRVARRAAFTLLTVVLLSGCHPTIHGDASPRVPAWARGNGPRVAAVTTQHFLHGRVVGIVDVTRDFPDQHAEGAFVLVDRLVGTRLARNDYRRRPVLAVYGSWQDLVVGSRD